MNQLINEMDIFEERLKSKENLLDGYLQLEKVFSNNLRIHMINNNMKTQDLIRLMNTDSAQSIIGKTHISDSVVKSWLRGWKLPNSKEQYALAAIFDVSISDFYRILTACDKGKQFAPVNCMVCRVEAEGEDGIKYSVTHMLADGSSPIPPFCEHISSSRERDRLLSGEYPDKLRDHVINAINSTMKNAEEAFWEDDSLPQEYHEVIERTFREWNSLDISDIKIKIVGKRRNMK